MTIWELATKSEKPLRCDLCEEPTYAEIFTDGTITCSVCESALCDECIGTYADKKAVCKECLAKQEKGGVK